MARLEEAASASEVPAEISVSDILRSVERALGAKDGETMGSTIVRDAATGIEINVASFADGRDYQPLPEILGQILHQFTKDLRAKAGTETYMAIWVAGSNEVQGAPPGEDHPLVKQMRTALAARIAAMPPVRRGPVPPGAKVFAGDRRIA